MWRVRENVTLPEDAVLIPGVIPQSTVLVEHPGLVAERIERFAGVAGHENGARLACQQLWGGHHG